MMAMTDPPQPRITEVNRPFWDGCRAGKLMLQRCGNASYRSSARDELPDALIVLTSPLPDERLSHDQ